MSCFTRINGTVMPMPDATVCGTSSSTSSSPSSPTGALTCCHNGDACMSDGFCEYSHAGIQDGSGFYRAGCTDSSYTDLTCPPECGNEAAPDAVFDFDQGQWRCCGGTAGGNVHCVHPLGVQFAGPSPGELNVLHTGVQAESAPAVSATPSSAAHFHHGYDNGGLTKGAVIGISVGVSVGTLLILAILSFFLARAHRRRQSRPFKLGDEPALLPASIRSSTPMLPSQLRTPPSTYYASSMHSNRYPTSMRSVSTYVSDNGGQPWPLRPSLLRRGTDESSVSAQSVGSIGGESISTWSSFSSVSAREPHVEITIPERAAVHEMGERSPLPVPELSGISAIMHELPGSEKEWPPAALAPGR